MKSKKAVFESQLALSNMLIRAEQLYKTDLFDQQWQDAIDADGWKPDFNHIFQLIHQNYANPRAMNCFIFYDIHDNRIRKNVSKYLLQKGCQRIQKSVFLGNLSKTIYDDMFQTLDELQCVLEENDSIFMAPVGEYHLAELKLIGKDTNMSFAKSNEYVLFI